MLAVAAATLAGCASGSRLPTTPKATAFERIEGNGLDSLFRDYGDPPAKVDGRIQVLIIGSVLHPGYYSIDEAATVADLHRMMDGPGFLYCARAMLIVREAEGEVAAFSAVGSELFSVRFALKHGDRIHYVGGGI